MEFDYHYKNSVTSCKSAADCSELLLVFQCFSACQFRLGRCEYDQGPFKSTLDLTWPSSHYAGCMLNWKGNFNVPMESLYYFSSYWPLERAVSDLSIR